MTMELKPCPFCPNGGVPAISGHWGSNGHVYYVKCDVCESEGPGDSEELEAIERWNSRHAESQK